ncbi:MAG: hypothetical protein KDA78_03765, partial [Planctomycetaceae bacterium]|nr:hypothetical protein [Planctomycetaceae bacterium]
GALRLDQESLEQTIEQSQEHLDQLSTRLAEEKHSLLEIKNETETVRRDLERVTSDLSSLTGQLESVQQEKTTQTERAESLRGQILELDQLIDQQNQQAQAINEKLRGLHDELELVKVEATKIQQKQLAVEGVKKRLLKDRELRLAQYHEAKLRLENGTSKQAQIDLQILNSRSRLAELYLIGEQFSVSVVAARRMRSDIQSQRDRLNEQLRSHSEVRREQ